MITTIIGIIIINFFGWLLLLDENFVEDLVKGKSKIIAKTIRILFLLFPTITFIILLIIEILSSLFNTFPFENIISGLIKLIKGV